ncbi:hypothetical protein ACIGEP_11830 [Microbacterium sp. NPDC077663]|uniref:hypothetical protein n=1 Tax=Microbacterium sp. NPDC077663 TaxID=3364189 RepID=UPI0037C82F9B
MSDLRYAFLVTRGHGSADAAIAAHDGGTVLLDMKERRVIRRYGTGDVTAEYVRMRRAFTAHVGAPAFTVGGAGEFVVEELILGEHLLDLPLATRVSALRRLISEYARLTAHAGVEGAGMRDLLTHVFDRLIQNRGLRDRWDAAHLGDLATRMTWVPSAYEATAKNLMVSRGQRPVPIDLGDLQMQPFFAYPVGVLISAGGDVLDAFRRGVFDAEFEELWAAAGQTWSGGDAAREGVLVARAAFAATRDHDAGVPGGIDELFGARLTTIQPWLNDTRTGGFV